MWLPNRTLKSQLDQDLCPGCLLPELLSQGSGWLTPSCSPTECWATHASSPTVTCPSHHSPCLLACAFPISQCVFAVRCHSAKCSWAGLGPSEESCSEFRDLVDGPLIPPTPTPQLSLSYSIPLDSGMGQQRRVGWDV